MHKCATFYLSIPNKPPTPCLGVRPTYWVGPRFFSTLVPGSGNFQLSRLGFSVFGLWVRVRVLGSDNHNRFPN